jgi:hypothetical protein
VKLFLHVHTRDRNYKPVTLRMRDAWEESKHPRGQPDNPGQFASGGGSSQPSLESTASRSERAPRTTSGPRTKSSKAPPYSPMSEERQAKFDKARADIEEIVNPFNKSEAEKKEKKVLSISLGKVVDKVAEAFDYTKYRDKVQIVDDLPKSIQFQGRTVLGNASLDTGVIRINKSAANAMNVPGTIAHEIMHQKFQKFLNMADEESKQVMELVKKDNYKNHKNVLAPDDSLRPEYKNQFPIYDITHPAGSNNYLIDTQKLMDDDGITEYSREWWKAFSDAAKEGRPMSPITPIHETLAEMGNLEMEGSLHRLLWYKDSTSYRPLYEAIQKFTA